MSKFKIGERVEFIGDEYESCYEYYSGEYDEDDEEIFEPLTYLSSREGVIVEVRGRWCSVEFDEYIYGHDCNELAEDGYGMDIKIEDLKLLLPEIKFKRVMKRRKK